jgi:hypothetical protein
MAKNAANGKGRQKFRILYVRVCAQFNDFGIGKEIKKGLWVE